MFEELLTIDELDANTCVLASDPRVTLTPLGPSRLGRPINMISIGEGDRNALIVGVPHPNEPASAVTVERMIAELLNGTMPSLGYRWHFIKAIDPEGLALNGGWLKEPLTIGRYLENFFRPALERQPETTFPLDIPGTHFDRSTPENLAWQKAFALTCPEFHASLHHCDYGGGFFNLSRPQPGAIARLEAVLDEAGFGAHDLDGDVMTQDEWSRSVSRYPSVPELVEQAAKAGASWANPWTVGEMSPGFGESKYGTLTLIAEAPLWDSAALHDEAPSDVTRHEQGLILEGIIDRVSILATRHIDGFRALELTQDAEECLSALAESFKMMPRSENGGKPEGPPKDTILTRRQFENIHTRQVLFALRTCGLLHRLARLVLTADPDCSTAQVAAEEAQRLIRQEVAAIDSRTQMTPVPLATFTTFQIQAILACLQALNDA